MQITHYLKEWESGSHKQAPLVAEEQRSTLARHIKRLENFAETSPEKWQPIATELGAAALYVLL